MSELSQSPRLAVLVPIFRHSSLLIETVESLIEQTRTCPSRIILINDGCPYPETEQVCRDYALARPDIISYLRKPNGGLSDARNFGIQHVLADLPSVEAVYLMDADNLLRPGALGRALAVLDAEPDIDWLYPDIDMFGLSENWDLGGDYSMLIHTAINICEAGSLIRRRVFEGGVMFDTEFKQGWEDWDFFLQAAEQGFSGRNLEGFGFKYRKRPESMLADSARDAASIAGAMMQKHKKTMQSRSLVALEGREAPRYAILQSDTGSVLYCVDPDHTTARRLSFEEFTRDCWNAINSPGRYRVPPITIVMTSAVMEALRRLGCLHWVLWSLERRLSRGGVSALVVSEGARERYVVEDIPAEARPGAHLGASVFALSKRILGEVLQDKNTAWIESLAKQDAAPDVSIMSLRLPTDVAPASLTQSCSAAFDVISYIRKIWGSDYRSASLGQWEFRNTAIQHRGNEHLIVRKAFQDATVFPRLTDGRRHVGFLLPMVEFGGVEKVALQMARGLRSHGWVPHAFVLGSDDIALTPEWAETFESTNLLTHSDFSVWGGGPQDYLGTNVPKWAQSGHHGTALGMLHWLDAAINFQCGAVVGIMGQLRRIGVTTLNSLHLNDMTLLGRPVGNTYLGVAFEHAFDYFVPCSHQLGHWLHGMGVPHDKIVPVQNAPGFDIDPEVTASGIAARKARSPAEPLRVLYLGRLDRQKGLDRLVEVIRRSTTEDLNLDWRIMGKAVMADDATPIPPEVAMVLEPPVSSPAELAAAYAWADVVILMSRFEGLPLTILEAMRAGAVPMATDVGAVSEVIIDGENGVLLGANTAVEDALAALRRLTADRDLLLRMSEAAFAERAGYDWLVATAELHHKMSALCDKAASSRG